MEASLHTLPTTVVLVELPFTRLHLQDPSLSNHRTTLLCGHWEGPVKVMWPSQANQSFSLGLFTWSWRRNSLFSVVTELKGPYPELLGATCATRWRRPICCRRVWRGAEKKAEMRWAESDNPSGLQFLRPQNCPNYLNLFCKLPPLLWISKGPFCLSWSWVSVTFN